MKKVILIADCHYVSYGGIRGQGRMYVLPISPLSILALGSYLAEHDVPVEIVDVAMDFGIGLTPAAVATIHQRVIRQLNEQADDIAWIGVSQIESLEYTFSLARAIHTALPQLPLVFGGYVPSRIYSQLLRDFPFITAIVRGDGEAAALAISRALDRGEPFPSKTIPNLAWLDGDEIQTTPLRPAPLDELPILDFRLLRHPNCYPAAYVMTSRGCPFHCIYCLEASMRSYAPYSPAWVTRQLDHLQALGVNPNIFFVDPIFGVNRERTLELCAVMRDRGFSYWIESRVDVLAPDLLPALREAGVERIALGVESASPAALLRMHKVRSQAAAERYVAQALELAAACFENNVTPTLNILLSFPGDTEADYEITLRFIKKVAQLHDRITARTGVRTGFTLGFVTTEIHEGSPLAEQLAADFPQATLSPETAPGTRKVLSPSPGVDQHTAQTYRERMLRWARLTPLARERAAHYRLNLQNLVDSTPECSRDDEDSLFLPTALSATVASQTGASYSQATPLPSGKGDAGIQPTTLLHVGYAKAASTFLQRWFQQHPQLRYAPDGLGGFDTVYDLTRWAARNPEQSPRYYVTSQEQLGAGLAPLEGSAALTFRRRGYGDDAQMSQRQAQVCATLAQLFPNSRVLIVTRGYEGSLRSLYSEYIKGGGDLAFLPFLTAHRDLLLQWLDINYLVELYATVFGQENLIVLPYERLRDDSQGFLALLEESLGLAHHASDPGRVNPSLAPAELYWYATLSRRLIAPWIDRLSDRAAGRLYRYYAHRWVQPNRLRPVIRLLDRVFNRQEPLDALPDGYWDELRGQATILKQYPLYAGYLAEYLLEES